MVIMRRFSLIWVICNNEIFLEYAVDWLNKWSDVINFVVSCLVVELFICRNHKNPVFLMAYHHTLFSTVFVIKILSCCCAWSILQVVESLIELVHMLDSCDLLTWEWWLAISKYSGPSIVRTPLVAANSSGVWIIKIIWWTKWHKVYM